MPVLPRPYNVGERIRTYCGRPNDDIVRETEPQRGNPLLRDCKCRTNCAIDPQNQD